MSAVVIAGDTSGSVTLQAPATAGSSVLNLPTGSGDLISSTSTSTLTNKTINGANNTITNISAASLTGAVDATNGGTGLTSYSTGDIIYASASNTLSKLAAGTNGYVLTLSAGVPTWAAAGGGGGVSSFSAGTTGFTPSTGTTGSVTLSGTLATTNGGTGITGFTAANNAIYSTSSSALTAGTLPVAAGGTGATTASTALSNLGGCSTGKAIAMAVVFGG